MDESSIADIDWAVYDSGDDYYYYNRVTQETTWEAPAEVLDWEQAATNAYLKEIDSPWRIGRGTKAGAMVYFFNKQTKKSIWKRPTELDEINNFLVALSRQRRDQYDAQQMPSDSAEDATERESEGADLISSAGQEDDPAQLWRPETSVEEGGAAEYADGSLDVGAGTVFEQPEAEQADLGGVAVEEEVDIAAMLPLWEKRLQAPDSIMEVDVASIIDKYLKASKVRPAVVVQKLCDSYTGYAKMTELLSSWLEVSQGNPPASAATAAAAAAEGAPTDSDDFLYGLLSKLIKQKFDKKLADSLIRPGSEVPSWLTEMMNDPKWRKLLIELLDSNRGSALLGYCLRQISSMGYHREIGQTIRDADYFLVFCNLLQDFLIKIVSADAAEICTRTSDLTRMCCNCDYLFLYAQEFLSLVEAKLLDTSSEDQKTLKRKLDDVENSDQTDEPGLKKQKAEVERVAVAVDRVRRVREEIERNFVWKLSTFNSSDSEQVTTVDNTLLSNERDKTKLDMKLYFSLRMTSFFISMFNSPEEVYREIADILRKGIVEEFHAKRLCTHILGLDERSDDVVIGSAEISFLLKCSPEVRGYLGHYQIFAYLMDSLAHPKRKLTSTGGYTRCAALITAVALTGDANMGSGAESESEEGRLKLQDEFNALMSDLLSACSLCDEILAMEFAGGLVLDRCESLVALIRKHRVISLCVLRWLNYTISDNNFVSSPAYANLCPILLQFVVTSTELYPIHHPECFAILQLMYENKAKFEDADTGRTVEIVSIKRDIIDSVVYLIARGYTSGPLDFLAAEVLVSDAAVVRHIVLSVSESFSPPFDVTFANKIMSLILSASSRKALSSKYFEEKHGPKLLKTFADNISKLPLIEKSKLSQLRDIVAHI
jgi:hypothetical protein